METLATVATNTVEHAALGGVARMAASSDRRNFQTVFLSKKYIIRRVGNVCIFCVFRLVTKTKGGKPFVQGDGCRMA
jgi:hypothetical protein